tara:strand:+ start:1272 stop:2903 length:1632 start_codon:yes stop_codon:yes gene_type:complete
MAIDIFGFEIVKKGKKPEKENPSFVPALSDDDGGYVVDAGGHYGAYLDQDGGKAENDKDLILKYRNVAMHAECDMAIDDIINEAIVSDDTSSPVDIVLDDLEQPDRIKKLIRDEFEYIGELLNMNFQGHDIFRRWYVDGRLYYHKIIDDKNPKKGLIEVRPIDATKIRKVKEVIKGTDPASGAEVITGTNEFYIYEKQGIGGVGMASSTGLKIAPDSITYVTSGLFDPTRTQVLSHLHKAIKPCNQLRMMEDSLVVYRMSRAPERRIFYIDVGNLPKGKAEEYLRNIMARYKNKMVYDASTGELKDNNKHMSMLEDFWLPRREGGRGTEISTLPGGDNLGQIDDIVYFQKKLYKSLTVPVSRLDTESQSMISLGRASETTREELKFQKFISRLRKKFSNLFIDMLHTQLILKGIVNEEEWAEIKHDISIDFIQDSHFAEMKNAELLRERILTLREVDDYVGRYYSAEWVRKNILMQGDEEIEEIIKQIETEKAAADLEDDGDEIDEKVDVVDIAPIEPEAPVDIQISATESKLMEAMTKILED